MQRFANSMLWYSDMFGTSEHDFFLEEPICATSKQHALDTLGSLWHCCRYEPTGMDCSSDPLRQTWTPRYGVANFPLLLFAELGYSRWPLSIVAEVKVYHDLPRITMYSLNLAGRTLNGR